MKLKLYVWEGVLCDYTCGIMFALAHDAEEARGIILKEDAWSTARDGLANEPKVYDSPKGFAVWGGG